MTAAASPTALALIASAVAASPPAPHAKDGRARQLWLADVADVAAALYRRAAELDETIARLGECTTIGGIIVSAEAIKGRGVITLRPTMGTHADDPTATEPLRTPWLNEPAGAALFARARSLVGAECRFGKYLETGDDGRRFRMVAWIDPVGPPATSAPPEAPPVPARSVPVDPGAALLSTGAGAALMARVNALATTAAKLACRRALVGTFGSLDSIEAEQLEAAAAVVAGFESAA